MIIDDEVVVRQSFSDYFEDRLWRPVLAQSGEEALILLDETSPQCAIVDIRLGGMDGNAFIREAYRKKPQMAFVICTGSPEYAIPSDVSKLSGVSKRVFTKPVSDMADLEAELLRLLTTIATESGRDDDI
jgi:DNA-binding NtrC family response regulator